MDGIGKMLKLQYEALHSLKNVIWFKYERLFHDKSLVESLIRNFLPELEDFVLPSGKINIGGNHPKELIDLNNRNVITDNELHYISEALRPYKGYINFFGYKLI